MRKGKSWNFLLIGSFIISCLIISCVINSPSTVSTDLSKPKGSPEMYGSGVGGWGDAMWTVSTVSTLSSSNYYSIDNPINTTSQFIESEMVEILHNGTVAEPWISVVLNDTIRWKLNGTLTGTNYGNYTPPAAPNMLVGVAVFNFSSMDYFDINISGLMGENLTEHIYQPNETIYISYIYGFNITLTSFAQPRATFYPSSFSAIDEDGITKLRATGRTQPESIWYHITLPSYGYSATVGFKAPERQNVRFHDVVNAFWGHPTLGTGSLWLSSYTTGEWDWVSFSNYKSQRLYWRYSLAWELKIDSIDGVDNWIDQTKNPSNTFTRIYRIEAIVPVSSFWILFYNMDLNLDWRNLVSSWHNHSRSVGITRWGGTNDAVMIMEWRGSSQIYVKLTFTVGGTLTIKALDEDGKLIEEEVTADIYYAGTDTLFDSITFTDGDKTIRAPPDQYDIILTTPDGEKYTKSDVSISSTTVKNEVFSTEWSPFYIDWVLVGVVVGIAVTGVVVGVLVWWFYYAPKSKQDQASAWAILRERKKRLSK